MAGQPRLRITVVGVCASGKSELTRRLQARGIDAHSVAQEHSHVPKLWRHDAVPDMLVYLNVSHRTVNRRWLIGLSVQELTEQRRRLADARRAADLRVRTDRCSPEEVERRVLDLLASRGAVTGRMVPGTGGTAPETG